MDTLLTAVALFAGLLLGVVVSHQGIPLALLLVIVAAGAMALRQSAYTTVARLPLLARAQCELWIFAAISTIALANGLIIWATNRFPLEWLVDTGGYSAESLQSLKQFIGSGITAILAVVLTRKFEDGAGFFSPSDLFRDCMSHAYHTELKIKPPDRSQTYDALLEESVPGYTDLGWGFFARGVRAKILEAFLRNPAAP